MKINGSRVLITGGSSGLGFALAKELSTEGAAVATFARDSEKLARLHEAAPQVGIFRADVSSKDDIQYIAAQTFSMLGGVDILINNASSLGPTPLRPLLDTECEDLEGVLQTNLVGPFRLIKAIAPSMIARKRGLIINISSDAAVSGYPNWGAYSTSKAALDQLTRVLNAELGSIGIRSVAIDPGDMRTPMHFSAIPDADPSALKDPALSAKQIVEWIASGEERGERFRL